MPGQMPAGEEMEIFMPDKIDKLKIRILMCFVKMTPENCTVTGLARTLAVEKYAISRAMLALEKEGLLDRSDSRRPKLTAAGAKEAGIL